MWDNVEHIDETVILEDTVCDAKGVNPGSAETICLCRKAR